MCIHDAQFLFNKTNQTHDFPKFYFVSKVRELVGKLSSNLQEYTIAECTVDNS
jgi:hypothetical protein